MKKRIIYTGLGIISLFTLINSCVKETYDMEKLSTKASIDIGVSVPVVKGSLTLGNAIESNDTLRFLEDNSISIVFEEDSLFTFDVSEILDIPEQDEHNKIFKVGALALDDFSDSGSVNLDKISSGFPPALRATIEALDGSSGIFPPIPSLPGDSVTINSFANFAWVEFSSGTATITITNNLPVEVDLEVALRNASDNSQIGNSLFFNNIPAGGTANSQMDLTGEIVTNSLIAELVSISSPGSSPDPVSVDMDIDNISVSVATSDLTIVRGQAYLPEQLFLSVADTIQFNLDNDVEVTFLEFNTAHIDYTLESHFAENMEVVITLPTSLAGTDTTRFAIPLGASGTQSGQLSLNNTVNDFSVDPAQPYNSIPFKYGLSVKPSGGGMVDFDLTDSVNLTYKITDIDFSYVEGYFGQHSFDVDEDSIDLEIEEIEDHISGTITFTNPIVNINYSNSVGVPVSFDLNLIGSNSAGETKGLNASIMNIAYPADRDNSPVVSTESFNKDNTDIVELIEIRPSKITYSGGATVNPSGKQGWDNFVTGESSVVAGLEVEIPFEFRANNLTLQDTLENPLKPEDSQEDEDFSIDNIESASLHLLINNGFPLEIGFNIQLYDSTADQVLATLDVPVLFPAAPVDANGVVTEPTEDTTTIVITGDFLENLEIADELIVRGLLNTSNNGSQVVKILTTYTIDFKFGVSTRVSYEFDFDDSDDN
ncbi:MAG: hypothetical protein IMY71_02835 [Bacteroidetes bacterium]|nr:hypothetical protein [Bacteroidota bacterium]